jgi:hypothetical protein
MIYDKVKLMLFTIPQNWKAFTKTPPATISCLLGSRWTRDDKLQLTRRIHKKEVRPTASTKQQQQPSPAMGKYED